MHTYELLVTHQYKGSKFIGFEERTRRVFSNIRGVMFISQILRYIMQFRL